MYKAVINRKLKAKMSEANLEVVNIDVPSKQEILVEPKTAEPQMDVMNNLIPQTASFDQVSAKEYLQQNVFPKLEVALNDVSSQTTNVTVDR